jgi:1-acyl-sn-glycerol-3-phosphate acyltransferase
MLIRSIIYYFLFIVNLVLFCIICLPLFILPQKTGLKLLKLWAKSSQYILLYTCKIDFEVRGKENIPNHKALIASKHQSTWETINYLHILEDPIMILKKELILIPFFGLYAIKFGNIAIKRSSGSKALKELIQRTKRIKKNKRPIIIFPEGTRQKPSNAADYKRGVFALYKNLNIPCIPVALNSGIYWPKNQLRKIPGKIIIEFLDPIDPGLTSSKFMSELESRIENATKKLVVESKEID